MKRNSGQKEKKIIGNAQVSENLPRLIAVESPFRLRVTLKPK